MDTSMANIELIGQGTVTIVNRLLNDTIYLNQHTTQQWISAGSYSIIQPKMYCTKATTKVTSGAIMKITIQ